MKTISFLIFLIFLSSCGKHLEKGIIVNKQYEPSKDHIYLMPMPSYSGKTTTIIMIPYLVHDNEDFLIQVEGIKKGDSTKSKEWIYVSKKCYNSSYIGDTWEMNSKCSLKDLNNIMEKKQYEINK